MKCTCRRCGANSSVFWTPFTIGMKEDVGEDHNTFYLCDDCTWEMTKFLQGHTVNDAVIPSRRQQE